MVPFSVPSIPTPTRRPRSSSSPSICHPNGWPDFVEALANLVTTTPPLASAVKPLAAGLHDHTPYFATSFAEGDSLDVALKQFGPAALPDLVPRVRALAGVLDAAASRGILHGALHPRDVTVSNPRRR